jgi:hypothetical protein
MGKKKQEQGKTLKSPGKIVPVNWTPEKPFICVILGSLVYVKLGQEPNQRLQSEEYM